VTRPVDLARVGYQAYGDSVDWQNYAGLPMPTWEDLGEKIQNAWVAAAAAIGAAVLSPPPDSGAEPAS
jgi:hypothetical protein